MARLQLHPRPPSRRQAALITLMLFGLLALTASAERGVMLAASSSHSPPPPPAKIVAHSGDIRLCAVISPGEFARVTGTRATHVEGGAIADPLTGLQEVYCIYLDASDPQQLFGRGTINFEIAADAPTASRTFNAVKQSFIGGNDIKDVGDAAFSGIPVGASRGTGLVVVKGALLLYLSVGGDPHTVTRITTRLAKLVLARVAS